MVGTNAYPNYYQIFQIIKSIYSKERLGQFELLTESGIIIGNGKITSSKMRRGYVISNSCNLFVSPFRFGFFSHFLF